MSEHEEMQDISQERFESFMQANRQSQNDNNQNMTQMLATMSALIRQNTAMISIMQQQAGAVNRSYNVMPDLTKSIDSFDGEQGPETAEKWLRQLEVSARLHSWSDAFCFQTAKMQLVEAAKYWLAAKPEVCDWPTFKYAFQKTFLFRKSKTE
nr:unnamed protein product [Callosobruchus analis]